MAERLKKTLGVTPKLIPGTNGIYDVFVDEKLIFSKHNANRFPETEEIITLINS